MEIGTHLKTVKNTLNIFAVYLKLFWIQLENMNPQGPCSSRSYCIDKQSYQSGISCLKIRGSKKGIKKKPSQFMYLISGMCIFILHLQFKCNFELPSRKNKKLYAIGLVCNIQSQQI